MAKVLWVIHGNESYGERRAVGSLMRGVRAAGWQAEALSLTRGDCYQEVVADGFSVTCLDMHNTPGMHLARNRPGRLMQFLKLAAHQFPVRRKVLAEIRLRRPDVVHVLSKNILPAVAWAARRAHVPGFWEMTAVVGDDFPLGLNRRIYRLMSNHYDLQVLANSRYTAGTLPRLRRPAKVMYLGADIVQFDPDRSFPLTRANLKIPEDALVYVIVSRIDPRKGQQVFLESVRRVNDRRIHVVLVGDAAVPAHEAFVLDLKRTFGAALEGRVHFTGLSTQPEAYLALADVGVHSGCDVEAFGLSVVEAMIMGKPVLVHALGGPSETVEDGRTGWFVNAPTVEAFAAGIRRSLADLGNWKQMGIAARQRALADYTHAQQARRYQEFVQERLAENSAARRT